MSVLAHWTAAVRGITAPEGSHKRTTYPSQREGIQWCTTSSCPTSLRHKNAAWTQIEPAMCSSTVLLPHPLQNCHPESLSAQFWLPVSCTTSQEKVFLLGRLSGELFDFFKLCIRSKKKCLSGCNCQLPWYSVQTETLYSRLCFQRNLPTVSVTE